MARLLFLSPFQPRQRWVPRCPDPLQLKRQAPVPVMRKWPSLLGAALRIAWKWNADSWNSKPRQLVERRVKERWKVQVSDPPRKETMREVCVCTDIRELWGDVTRDDSQGRFFAQHSIATLLRHCNAVLREKSSLRIVSCNIIFSIDDNDGSENVTIKINSRFFNVFCVYSKLLKMPNVGEWPQAGFLGTVHKFSKTKKIRSRLFTSSRKREIRHFNVVVVQGRQRIVQKSLMHVQICFFFLVKLLLLWRSRYRRCPRCYSSLLLIVDVWDT